MQHIGDIPRRHVLHGDIGVLRVVENDVLSAVVGYLRVRSGLTVDALVRKRCVGRRHGADGHAVGQSAQRQRRQRDVGKRLALGVYII